MDFPDDLTLARARERLRPLVVEGHECPCCRQFAKVYRRTIHATMARSLIAMHREQPFGAPVHIPTLFPRRAAADVPKLRHWGLLIEEPAQREDGGRAGWWIVTPAGRDWVLERATVPKYAHVYANRCLRLDGPPVTIRDAVGARFDYRELMYGSGDAPP